MKHDWVTVALAALLAFVLISPAAYAKSSGGHSGGAGHSGGKSHSGGGVHTGGSAHHMGGHHMVGSGPVTGAAPVPRAIPLQHSGRGSGCPADYMRVDNLCQPRIEH